MPDPTNPTPPVNPTEGGSNPPAPNPEISAEMENIIKARVEEQLAGVKRQLDAAYGARDEANRKAAALEEQRKAAELAALEAAGKTQEALQMRLAAAEAREKSLAEQLSTLKRDAILSQAVSSLEFRNGRSRDMALQDLKANMVQDANGNWVHRTGAQLADFVKAYATDPENSFLFQPKPSSGGGSQGGHNPVPANKPITEMTTQELLAAAQSGRFGNIQV